MHDKSITMQKVFVIGGVQAHFATDPTISNNQILRFFRDITTVMKKLDPEVIDNPKMYYYLPKGPWWSMDYFKKYSQLYKLLRTSKEGNGVHEIMYFRNPILSNKIEVSYSEENSIVRIINEMHPNITLTSTSPVYKTESLVEMVKDFPYIEISENFAVIDPNEIRAVAEGKRPTKVLTHGGRIFDYMHNKFD